MKQLTEDEFDEQFTVIPDARGETVRPTTDSIDTDPKHLWTIVDADGSLYAVSGWHFVNRIGYILTEEAWTEETEAVWCEFSDDDEEEES
jgi:hypothetical protein